MKNLVAQHQSLACSHLFSVRFWITCLAIGGWGPFAAAATFNVPGDQPTIQAAIDNAVNGDQIVVQPGVYHERIHFSGKNLNMQSIDPGSDAIRAATVIDADSTGTVVTFLGTEGAECSLTGFTIAHGNGEAGGIAGGGTLATIAYNTITSNTSPNAVGGIFNCAGILHHNLIENNRGISGGGIGWCPATIRANVIRNNQAFYGAGLNNCDGLIENNLIYGNQADDLIGLPTPTYGSGGGLHGCDGIIRNNTIYGNSATAENFEGGGGLRACAGIIHNCIVWGNTAPIGAQLDGCTTPSYSCIQDWSAGGLGNIVSDPLLLNPAAGDFHLTSSSLCLEAGGAAPGLTDDLDGDPRPMNAIFEVRGDGSMFDIGADEFPGVPMATPTPTPEPTATPTPAPTPTPTPRPAPTPNPSLAEHVESIKILAYDGQNLDYFGRATALAGDRLVVGAPFADTFLTTTATNTGAAYVYRWNGLQWTDEAKLTAADGKAGDQFGVGVAAVGDALAVGAPFSDVTTSGSGTLIDAGAVYLYRWNGSQWAAETKLTAPDGAVSDQFGSAVAMAGDVLAVGAQFADRTTSESGTQANAGAVYLYRWNGSQWGPETKLAAPDGMMEDRFGASVALSADRLAVGAPLADTATSTGLLSDTGAAYIYRWDGSLWTQEAKLLAADRSNTDRLGTAVSLSDNVAAIGAPYADVRGNDNGLAYVFRWDGSQWAQEAALAASTCGVSTDRLGMSVAVLDDLVAVGIRWADTPIANAGAVQIYRWSGSQWLEEARLRASNATTADQLGYSVAVSGAWIAAGADRANGLIPDVGGVYLYDRNQPATPTPTPTPTPGPTPIPTPGPTPTPTGSIVAWGNNDNGQCMVPSADTDFIRVAAGNFHSLALRSNGSLVVWGSNDQGQCNLPTTNTGFMAVAAGAEHSLALRSDGSVVAWGFNLHGQCDLPTTNTDFAAISAGLGHSLALRNDGSVLAWGLNSYGQCDVPTSIGRLEAVSAGDYHSLGLSSDRTVVAWGWNNHGQVELPVPNSDFTAISAGAWHSLGLKTDGSIVAWGRNDSGQCDVPEPNTGFIAVSAGSDHSLGLRGDGSIVAWGLNSNGQCDVPPPNAGFLAVAAGLYHNLALRYSGSPVAPEMPILVVPGLGSIEVSISTVLLWTGGANATAFDLYLWPAWESCPTSPTAQNLTSNWYVPPAGLLPYATYCWQVVAKNPFGQTAGPQWVFMTGSATPTPAPTPTPVTPPRPTPTPNPGLATYAENARLTASDGQGQDYLGRAVAMDGDVLVVGAAFVNGTTSSSLNDVGAAYVYRRDGDLWVEEARLTAADGRSGERFGMAVAVSGDLVAVGSPFANNPTSPTTNAAGAVYLYRWNGTQWLPESKLTAADGRSGDQFGWSLAMTGDVVAVGTRFADRISSVTVTANDVGAAYIYRRNGSSWAQEAKLMAADGVMMDRFGFSLTLAGDRLLVGAPFVDSLTTSFGLTTDAGAAYVYRWDGAQWSQEAKLMASDGMRMDRFGHAVGLSGDVAVIGAPFADVGGTDNGLAYVFRWNGAQWAQEAALASSVIGMSGDNLGRSLAVADDLIALGMPNADSAVPNVGGVLLYRRSGGVWIEQARLLASNGLSNDHLGWAVAISGDWVAAGADMADGAFPDTGAVYLYELNQPVIPAPTPTPTPTPVPTPEPTPYPTPTPMPTPMPNPDLVVTFEEARLAAADGMSNDFYGQAVAMDGAVAAVGAYRADGATSDSGAVYLYRREGETWSSATKLTASDGLPTDQFGWSVALSGDWLAVGAPCVDDATSGSAPLANLGAVYLYRWNGTQWVEQSRVMAADGVSADRFGQVVALAGDRLAVGVPFAAVMSTSGSATLTQVGAVYLYHWTGIEWTEDAKLMADQARMNDRFGASVALTDDWLAVGAPFVDGGTSPTGALMDVGATDVYHRTGNQWNRIAGLQNPDGRGSDRFGWAVGLSGDTLVVGAPFADASAPDMGQGFVYRWDGGQWLLEARLTASDGMAFDRLGHAAAVDGDTIVLGASNANGPLVPDCGAAYVYRRLDFWQEAMKLVAGNGMIGDQAGRAVATDDDWALVGAFRGDGTVSIDTGAAYLFQLGEDAIPQPTPLPPNMAPVVDAGLDRDLYLPTQTAGLSGWAVDDDVPSLQLAVQWSQVEGPAAAIIANSGVYQTQVVFPAIAGTYRFRLTVGDGRLVGSDEIRIELHPQSATPTPTPTPPPAPAPPSIPTGVQATGGALGIRLNWIPNPEADLAGYHVYRDGSAAGAFAARLTPQPLADTVFLDSNVEAGTDYYYKVSAVNTQGQQSALSGVVTARAGSVVLTMPDYRGAPDTDVLLRINCSYATGITGNGLDLRVTYDKALLAPLEVQKTVLTQDFILADNIPVADGQVNISGISATGATIVGEGQLLAVKFHVLPTAILNTTGTHVMVDVRMYNAVLQPLLIDYSDMALFTVATDYVLGDPSGDGQVDSADALMVLQAALGDRTLGEEESSAIDVNGDGVVDSADATLILRMAVGLPINPPESGQDPSLAGIQPAGLSWEHTVSIGDIRAYPGDEVTVPVRLDNFRNLAGASVVVSYRPWVLQLLGVSPGAMTGASMFNYSNHDGMLRFSVARSTAFAGGSGDLAVLRFRVIGGAGQSSPLPIASCKLSGEFGQNLAWTESVSTAGGLLYVRDRDTAADDWRLYR